MRSKHIVYRRWNINDMEKARAISLIPSPLGDIYD